jgi:hypothetical protein
VTSDPLTQEQGREWQQPLHTECGRQDVDWNSRENVSLKRWRTNMPKDIVLMMQDALS